MSVFDAVAPEYDDWFETPLGSWIETAQFNALRELLPAHKGATVLEIGAGTGRVAARLASLGYTVTALEPSPPMLQQGLARTRGLDVRWIDGVAEALPLADEAVDIAVMFTTLEFVLDPVRALSEALRVTSPSGRFLAGILHALSPWAALYRHLADGGAELWASARFYTPEDLARLAGCAPTAATSAVHLAPQAQPPYEEAERSGLRAGNSPALAVVGWDRAPTVGDTGVGGDR